MWDSSVPKISLAMRCDDLSRAPRFAVPAPYALRSWLPGDEKYWADIERSAGEFRDTASALEGFRRNFPDVDELPGRMFFLTEDGIPFATATAWTAAGGEGRLHWVGVDAAHQGRRLSYPIVSAAVERMAALGCTSAILTTQTSSWVAIGVYRRFGFRPWLREPGEDEGWRIVAEKLGAAFAD